VFTALARFADADGRCFPSVSRICEQTGIRSRQTVHVALDRLAELGLITRQQRRAESGAVTSNGYELPFLCLSNNQTPVSKKPHTPTPKNWTPPVQNSVHKLDVDEREPTKKKTPSYSPNGKHDGEPAEPEDFARFWSAYPYRVKDGKRTKATKAEALDLWRRMPKADRAAALDAVGAYAGATNPEFVLDAVRWLKRKRWQDEVGAPVGANGDPPENFGVVWDPHRHFGSSGLALFREQVAAAKAAWEAARGDR
jgi:hypothetical protein